MNERAWELYSQILSQENLSLEYSNYVKTAYFDLENRKVVIPTFEYMTDDVTQLMISHEVGHATFSSYSKDEFTKYSTSFGDLFNVIEDVHVENNMKKVFNGLKTIFKEGYKTLYKENFFEIEGNLRDYSLTTRLNLFAKLGHLLKVPFDGRENEFALALKNVYTKEDVITLCNRIVEYIREEKETEENKETSFNDENDSFKENQSFDNDEIDNSNNDEEKVFFEEDCEDSSQNIEEKKFSFEEELTDTITEVFNKKMEEYGAEQIINNLTKSNSTLSISSKECYENMKDFTSLYSKFRAKTFYSSKACKTLTNKIISLAKSADTVFQQKKRAEELKTSKSVQLGRLDMRKLSKHKISDNIFKKTKIYKEGKNHGIVILVDFSASMTKLLSDTLIQACVLGEFCRMNDIPFVIIGYGATYYRDDTKITSMLGNNENFDIGCIMSLTKATPYEFNMLDTPTIEAIGVATYYIEAFRKAGVEKTSLFLITDGFFTPNRIKKGKREYFSTMSSAITIDNILYTMDNIIPANKRIHNNWIMELMLLNLKKRYNTFISFSLIGSVKTMISCLSYNLRDQFPKLLVNYTFERNRNISDIREYENYLYLWKHSYYFEDVSKNISVDVSNGILNYPFNKNPFLDLFQIFDYNDNLDKDEKNILIKTGNYHKRLKIFVNGFIERFA